MADRSMGSSRRKEKSENSKLKHTKEMPKDISLLRPDLGPSDLSLQVEDQVFPVHKSILEEKCDYFQAMFASGMRETTQDTITLQGISAPTFRTLLTFLYTADMDISGDVIQDVISAASFLQISLITDFIKGSLTVDSCIDVLAASSTYGPASLYDATIQFMTDNYLELMHAGVCDRLTRKQIEYIRESRNRGLSRVAILVRDEILRTVEYLDGNTGKMGVLCELPSEARVHNAGITVMDNYLFVVGGNNPWFGAQCRAFCYNVLTNEWRQIDSLIQRRHSFSLQAVDGRLYAIGGLDPACLRTVEMYDPRTDCWSVVSPLPLAITYFAGTVCLDEIYIAGGQSKIGRNPKMLCYSPTSDDWREVTSLCDPRPSIGLKMVAIGTKIYTIWVHNFDCYDILTDQWTEMCLGYHSDGIGLLCRGATVLDSCIYCVLRTSSAESYLHQYSEEVDCWKKKSSRPLPVTTGCQIEEAFVLHMGPSP
ncbi:kelch-like protein 26 [Branchiostoma floridae x Branchiostoma japonicum]